MRRLSGLAGLFFMFLGVTLLGGRVQAQDRCRVPSMFSDPEMERVQREAFEIWMKQKATEEKMLRQSRSFLMSAEQEVIRIPVVVHIIHNGEPYGVGPNIPDEQVLSQIRVLNEDFQRNNPDKENTPEDFRSVAANIGVEFVLAKQTPEGRETTGIVRIDGGRTSWVDITQNGSAGVRAEREMKAMSTWDPASYVNVWVANIGNNIFGFSRLPLGDLGGLGGSFSKDLDGVVVSYQRFGSEDHGAFPSLIHDETNKGRTLTHEMGHYLGLLHTWGSGESNFSCSSVNDYCDDTPITKSGHSSADFKCDHPHVGGCGEVVMFQNFMDYSADRCMNLFTEDQKFRIRTVLESSYLRKTLSSSKGLEDASDEPFYDLALKEVTRPVIVTGFGSSPMEITVENKGRADVSSFKVVVNSESAGIGEVEANVELELPSGEAKTLNLNWAEGIIPEGTHTLEVRLEKPNNDVDENTSNDAKYIKFTQNKLVTEVPSRENFSETPEWSVAYDGFVSPILGKKDSLVGDMTKVAYGNGMWLVSPLLDLRGLVESSMSFKYRFDRKGEENPSGKIEVLLSEAVPENYETSLFSTDFDSNTEEWRSVFLNLSDYAGKENVRVAIKVTGAGTGIVSLDDVNIYDTYGQKAHAPEGEIIVYPNPLPGNSGKRVLHVTANLLEEQELKVYVFGSGGYKLQEAVLPEALNHTRLLNFANYPRGVYIVRVKSREFTKSFRVLVK
ncbi:M43 family zinc metalloprotease [Fulvitalea axinellae]